MALEIEINSNSKQARADLERLNKSVDNISNTANQASKSLSTSFRVIGAATTALLGGAGLKGVSDSFTRINNQIALVTGRTNQLIATQNKLIAISRRANAGLEETVKLYSSLVRNTKTAEKDARKLTEILIKAGKVGGGSVQTINASLIQLQQGLASGVLRGQELQSVLEGLPRVSQAIAKELGRDVGALKGLAEQGKITAEVVRRALLSASKDIDKEFGQLDKTIGDAFRAAVRDISKGLNDILRVFNTGGVGNFIASLGESIGKALSRVGLQLRLFQIDLFLFRDDLERSFGSIKNAILFPLQALVGGIANATKGLGKAIKPFLDFANKVKDVFYDLYIYVVGRSVYPDMIDGILSTTKGLSSSLALFKGFADGVGKYIYDMYQNGVEWVSEFIDDIDNLITKLRYLPDFIRYNYGRDITRYIEGTLATIADNLALAIGAALVTLSGGAFLLNIGSRIAQGFLAALGAWFLGFSKNLNSQEVFNYTRLEEELAKQTDMLSTMVTGIGSVVSTLSKYAPVEIVRQIGAFLGEGNNLYALGATGLLASQLIKASGAGLKSAVFSGPGEGLTGRAVAEGIRASTNFQKLRAETFDVEQALGGLKETSKQLEAQYKTGVITEAQYNKTRASLTASEKKYNATLFKNRNQIDRMGSIYKEANKKIAEGTSKMAFQIGNLFAGVGGIVGGFLGAGWAQKIGTEMGWNSAQVLLLTLASAKVGEQIVGSLFGSVGGFIAGRLSSVFVTGNILSKNVTSFLAGAIKSALSGTKVLIQTLFYLIWSRGAALFGGLVSKYLTAASIKAAAVWLATTAGLPLLIAGAVAGAIYLAFQSDTLKEWGESLGRKIYDVIGDQTSWIDAAKNFINGMMFWGKQSLNEFVTWGESIADGIIKGLLGFDWAKIWEGSDVKYQSGARRKLKRARGGSVWGAGTSTSDSIPAMLSNGEFVVRSSVASQNRGLLTTLNNTGSLPGFAEGGYVGRAKEYIRKQEGDIPRVYADSQGYLTIGVGHLLTSSEARNLGIKVTKGELGWRAVDETGKFPNDKYLASKNLIVPGYESFYDKDFNSKHGYTKGVFPKMWQKFGEAMKVLLIDHAFQFGSIWPNLKEEARAQDYSAMMANYNGAKYAIENQTPRRHAGRLGLLMEAMRAAEGFATGGSVGNTDSFYQLSSLFSDDGSLFGIPASRLRKVIAQATSENLTDKQQRSVQSNAMDLFLFINRMQKEERKLSLLYRNIGLDFSLLWNQDGGFLSGGPSNYFSPITAALGEEGYYKSHISLKSPTPDDFKSNSYMDRFTGTFFHEIAHAYQFYNSILEAGVDPSVSKANYLSWLNGAYAESNSNPLNRRLKETEANIIAQNKLNKAGYPRSRFLEEGSQYSYLYKDLINFFLPTHKKMLSTQDGIPYKNGESMFHNDNFPNKEAIRAINALGVNGIEDLVQLLLKKGVLGGLYTSSLADYQVNPKPKSPRNIISSAMFSTNSEDLRKISDLLDYLRALDGYPPGKYARGGSVWGAGTATSDSIPALLSNGEFVVRSSVASQHRGVLSTLNNTGKLPGFSGGGGVSASMSGIGGGSGDISFFTRIFDMMLEQLREVLGPDLYDSIKEGLESIKDLFTSLFSGGKPSLTPGITSEEGLAATLKATIEEGNNKLSVDVEELTKQLKADSPAASGLIGLLEGLKAVQERAAEYAEQGLKVPLKYQNEIKKINGDIVRQVGDLIQIETDSNESLKFIKDAAKLTGEQQAANFEADFQGSFASLLKGDLSGGDFGDAIIESFTGKVLDSFAEGFTGGLFGSGPGSLSSLISGLFGMVAQTGENIGGNVAGGLKGAATTLGTMFNPMYVKMAGAGFTMGGTSGEVLDALNDPMFASEDQSGESAGEGIEQGGETAANSFKSVFANFTNSFGGMFEGLLGGLSGIFQNIGQLFSGGGGGGGGAGWIGAIAGLFFHTGGLVPDGGGYSKLNGGEMVLTEAQQNQLFRMAKGDTNNKTNQQQININVTGDISRQTKKEIYTMLPTIATGVNQYNRENR